MVVRIGHIMTRFRTILLMPGLCLASGHAVAATCQLLKVAELPLEPQRGAVLTRGEIDGHPASIVVDTGAEVSSVWGPSVQRLGLHLLTGPRMRLYGTVGGETQVEATVIKTLRLDKYEAHNLRLVVAGDLSAKYDFLLGADFLTATSLEFDLKHNMLRMLDIRDCKTDQLPYWSKTYSMVDLVASPRAARKYEIPVLLNGHPIRAQLDSGASASVVSSSVAKSIGEPQADSRSGQLRGVGPHTLDVSLGLFDTFTIGDETIRNPHIRVAQLGKYTTAVYTGSRIAETVRDMYAPDMLLGADFLRAHHALIDNGARKMVFTYEGGPVFVIGDAASPPSSSPTAAPASPQSPTAAPLHPDPVVGGPPTKSSEASRDAPER